jgi:transposase-like protein
MTKSREDHRNRMYEMVRQYESSQQGQRAFCAQHCVKVSTLNYWIRRYRRDHQSESAGGKMVRLQIKDVPMRQIRIVTGSGIQISIPI